MIDTSCAFTGHRPYKFPWKNNDDDLWCIALKKILTEQITALAEAGTTDFFSGMADGTDHYCSQIVLTLHEKNPGLKHYYKGCMIDRNHRLVDSAGLLLAVYNGVQRSDTGSTVNYTRKMGRELIVIDPITRHIKCEGPATDLHL